jgi:hypothetical protein
MILAPTFACAWRIMLRILTIALCLSATAPAFAQTVVDDSARGIPPAELQLVFQLVSERLVDPGSAQYRNLSRIRGGADGYCGEVNAKNKAGAYAGFAPFAATRGRASVLTPDLTGDARTEIWGRLSTYGCLRR